MKKNQIIIFALLLALSFSCTGPKPPDTATERPRVQVKTVHVSQDVLPDELELIGKTMYLNTNPLVAPISGYVISVHVAPGEAVTKDSVLFVMQSQEAYALQNGTPVAQSYGIVTVVAPANGVINQLNVFKKSVYIDKGSPLCEIVELGSLFVETEVPYEYLKYIQKGKACRILLPDSSLLKARFTRILPHMDEQSQTQKVWAKLREGSSIPEHMIVKVLVEKQIDTSTQIVPVSCVMTDALMTKYWVMKLMNDTMAVQIPVRIGRQTHGQVEIVSPIFNARDRIISEGAYGLSDTVMVEEIK